MAGTTARWTLRPECAVRFHAGVFAGLAVGEQVTCEVTPLFGGTRIPAAPPMEYAGRVDARGTIAGTVTVPAGRHDLRVRIGDVEGTVPFEAVEGRVTVVEALVR